MSPKRNNTIFLIIYSFLLIVIILGVISYIWMDRFYKTGLVIDNNSRDTKFSIKLTIPDRYREISGGSLITIVDIYSMPSQINPIDLPLTIYITDINQSRNYYSITETFALETHASIVREIYLPSNLLDGNYLVVAKSNYLGRDISSSESFQIVNSNVYDSTFSNIGSILAFFVFVFLNFLILKDLIIKEQG